MKATRGQKRLRFPNQHGGNRKHDWARRMRRRGRRVRVPHRRRAALAARFPVHVTMRVAVGLPSLRRLSTFWVVRRALVEGARRGGFRVNHYSVQSNHVHLICEATDRDALSRGMQGLAVRIARRLNRLWRRRGAVWSERYHDRILRSPKEVRFALGYVLNNSRHHGVFLVGAGPCPYSSGAWSDGWSDYRVGREAARRCPLPRAWTALQRSLWRRHGLLSTRRTPVGA